MKSPLELARPELRQLIPYSSARREADQGDIWLNANESPWANTDGHLNRYPEPQPLALRQQLSKLYETTTQQLLLTRGSDEGIDLLIRGFCRAGKDAILTSFPSYGVYEISAAIQNAAVISVPLNREKDFALDVEAVLKAYQTNIKLLFLCSPNNPTGNVLANDKILVLCEALQDQALVVVDEAYIEFADSSSCIQYLAQYPNLVILRTLSKAYGLAGARCGSVIAHPEIIQLLENIIAPYPIASPVIQLLEQQLTPQNIATVQEQIALIKQQRDMLQKFLQEQPWVKKVWPSQSNFLFLQVEDVKKLMRYCEKHGIVLRDRSFPELDNCVRISIGTPEENQQLCEVLKNVS